MKNASLADLFVGAVNRLLPDFQSSNDSIGLAVSGGPDSIALLLLAKKAFPGRIAAATVDHGLRPEACDEAEFVAKLCADRDVPHEILTPSIPIRGSVQAEARKARYSLLKIWMERQSLTWLATAHHADDQLETLVMRVLRGSGIDGMSAIRARRGHIIRPLLAFSKTELVNHVVEQNIAAVDDPSNREQGYDRVRVREALSGLEGFDISLASQSAAALDDAREALQWMVDKLSKKHIETTEDGCRLNNTQLPHEITRRLLLKCLHICDPALSPRGAQIERAIKALICGETVTIGDILCKGSPSDEGSWTFSPAPKRRNI